MIGREWSERTVLMPADFVEDPTFHRDTAWRRGLSLYYSRGASLQDQRIYRRSAETPLGPVGDEDPAFDSGVHSRIERGRISEDLALFTASWPGPPTGGIMAYRRHTWGDTRTLVLTVKPDTGYSYIAANPCVTRTETPNEFDLIFEGCTDAACDWHLFRATWRPGSLAVVDDEPLFAGANPSLFVEDGWRYLTFSRLTKRGYAAGFETCAVRQEAP